MIPPRAAQIRAVGTAFLRQRPLVTIPVGATNALLFALGGAPRTQLVWFGAGMVTVQAMFVIERVVGLRRALTERTLARSLVITAVALAAACAISGGLASPITPLLLAPTAIAFAAFGRAPASLAILAIVIGAAIALAALPGSPTFPPLASPYRELGMACGITGAAILLMLGVAALADAHAAAAAALARAGEDAAARARDRDAIGAHVAHEVKNPLAAIRGLVEVMLEAHPEGDRDHKRLAVIAGEVARIEAILRDYLEHQRPLAELEPVDHDIAVSIRDVVAVLEARADRAGIALVADGPSLVARVDPRRLQEAFLNLALNALDAVSPGQRVELRWRRDDDQLAVTVADTGRGMTPDELARLGTPGYTTRPDGSGLGVVLARAVVEQHGGRLDFSSTPGRGTIATIRLPWPRS